MNEIPTMGEEPDDADERYRRLSDRDVSGPNEAVRSAILQHAAELAAQVAGEERSTTIVTPVARKSPRLLATYGGLAVAAALAGLLVVPRFLTPSTAPVVRTPQKPTAAETTTSAAAPSPPPSGEQGTEARASAARGLIATDGSGRPVTSAPQAHALTAHATAAPQALASAAFASDPATALRDAAAGGDVPALHRFLAAKPDIDARDASGRTALMLAVLHGQTEAVITLLAAGADPNAADAQGTRPLQAALAGARSAMAVALEQSGAR